MDPNDGQCDDRKRMFDRWSEDYDASVRKVADAGDYPFAGYDRVMERICYHAGLRTGDSVLDLGTGTANLAGLLADNACDVTGTDSSTAMLEQARGKLPGAKFIEADLTRHWPESLRGPWDAVVSAYVFHEFPLKTKIEVVHHAISRTRPSGRVVVGDIAFPTKAEHDAARDRIGDRWDSTEEYWIASEVIPRVSRLGVRVEWEQISPCAGVFVFGAET